MPGCPPPETWVPSDLPGPLLNPYPPWMLPLQPLGPPWSEVLVSLLQHPRAAAETSIGSIGGLPGSIGAHWGFTGT